MTDSTSSRRVAAVHGRQSSAPDPADTERAQTLKAGHPLTELIEMYGAVAGATSVEGARMRAALWTAMAKRAGHSLRVGTGALIRHSETFEFGGAEGDQALPVSVYPDAWSLGESGLAV